MSDLIKSGEGGLMGLLHGQGGLTVPKPFERDIFLYYTHVAGTSYVEGIEELEPYLNVDDRLDLFREPDNRYDKRAIAVKTLNGVKIGYIPRGDNIIFSRLMDAGKLLYGQISNKSYFDGWLKIDIKIYLHE